MIKHILLLLAYSVLIPVIGTGQTQSEEFSDPVAAKILSEMRSKLESMPAFTADFTLTYEIPQQENVVHKGNLTQQDRMYHLKVPGMLMLSDGEQKWIYQDEINEVQLYSVNNDDTSLETPMDFLRIAESEDYVFAVAGTSKDGDKTLTQVEFKPLNSSNEYTKIRLSVDDKTRLPHSLIAFARDGSRTLISLKSISQTSRKAQDFYQFDKAKYPGVHLEDLRID